MLERLKTYDWKHAFEYAGPEPPEDEYDSAYGSPSVSAIVGWDGPAEPFTRADVVEILGIDDGENDERNWVGLFRLRNGLYAFLSAGCDYTGWDCQAGGAATVGPDLEIMLRLGMSDEDRDRMGLKLIEALR